MIKDGAIISELKDIQHHLQGQEEYRMVNMIDAVITTIEQSQDRERVLNEELDEAQFNKAQENKRNRWLCAQVKQAEDRERLLREALSFIANQSKESIDTSFIYNVHNYINELKLIQDTAKEALEASK